MARFLAGELSVPRISEINRQVLDRYLQAHAGERVDAVEGVLAADAWAREQSARAVREAA